jgi:hypothetical protein
MNDLDIEKLKFDEHNFNLHTQDGMQKLERSVTDFGYGRSILLDKDDNIIGGNGVVETAKKMGLQKVRVVETDGDELIAVRRKDLSINSKEGRSLALADNAVAAANLNWNKEELEKARTEWDVVPEDWGVKMQEEGAEETYSREIITPVYTPNGTTPTFPEMYDTTKYDELVKEIAAERLPKEVKTFLLYAASRHIVFNYENIANYYAQASKKVQELMERSALVIIDFQKAIEGGYVKLTKDLMAEYAAEYTHQEDAEEGEEEHINIESYDEA